MKIRNIALLAVLAHNDDATASDYPFSVLVIQLASGGGKLALPFIVYDGEDSDLKVGVTDYINNNITFHPGVKISPSELHLVQTYCVDNKDGNTKDIVTAYMVTIEGMPLASKADKSSVIITALWMNIETMMGQSMFGNHNAILKDIRARLLEIAVSPTNASGVYRGTNKEIIRHYFDDKLRDEWIKKLCSYGFNIYPNSHPEVAVDVVLFGYRDDEFGHSLSVMLTKRSYGEEGANRWGLPSTYIKTVGEPPVMESQLEAAKRALREKTHINTDNISFYPLKPFSHPARMRGKNEEGVSVITLPLFAIVKYEDVNPSFDAKTERTSGCNWFPIERILLTKQGEGGQIIREGVNAYDKYDLDDKGQPKKVFDTKEFTELYSVRDETDKLLLSPDEIGLPAADVYLNKGALVCKYYQEPDREIQPIQDGVASEKTLFADHANIILAALHALKELSHFDTFVAKLIPESTSGFDPILFLRRWEDVNWPFKGERANFSKRVKAKGILEETLESKAQKEEQKASKLKKGESISTLGKRAASYIINIEKFKEAIEKASPIIR